MHCYFIVFFVFGVSIFLSVGSFPKALLLKDQGTHSTNSTYYSTVKIAVLLETRQHRQLLPVIDNFATHLPMDWRMQLFLSNNNVDMVRTAPVIKDWIKSRRIIISHAPSEITSTRDYNAILQSASFWQSIQGERVLIFQIDSVLCRAATRTIDHFVQYDYVGAPWHLSLPWARQLNGTCGNGGLSLRSKSKSLEAISVSKPDPGANEDLWFCFAFLKLGANFAPRSEALQFSVETTYYEQPLGMHKPNRGLINRTQLLTLFDNCPEGRMVQPDMFNIAK